MASKNGLVTNTRHPLCGMQGGLQGKHCRKQRQQRNSVAGLDLEAVQTMRARLVRDTIAGRHRTHLQVPYRRYGLKQFLGQAVQCFVPLYSLFHRVMQTKRQLLIEETTASPGHGNAEPARKVHTPFNHLRGVNQNPILAVWTRLVFLEKVRLRVGVI